MDADRIARFTGPYNLPGGMVPVVDGIPRWPWDEVVARRRLGQVAKLAGLRLSGGEVFVESGSNDTWLVSGDTVLQVCYRGDVDRLVREAELLAVLPGSVPAPAVLDYGRDRLMSWILVKRVHAGSLWHAWPSEPGTVLRSYVWQLAQIMRSLHSWQPPAQVTWVSASSVPPSGRASRHGMPADAGVQRSLRPLVRTSPATPTLDTAIGSSSATTASTSRVQIHPPRCPHFPRTPGLLAVSTATSASIFGDGGSGWSPASGPGW
jgi:hypothetical protein